MGPFLVVVIGPGPDQGAGMRHGAEHGFIQKLIAHAAIEAFGKAVLHRLSGGDVVPVDLAICGEGEDRRTSLPPHARPECR